MVAPLFAMYESHAAALMAQGALPPDLGQWFLSNGMSSGKAGTCVSQGSRAIKETWSNLSDGPSAHMNPGSLKQLFQARHGPQMPVLSRGSFDRGLVFFRPNDPTQILSVPARAFIPDMEMKNGKFHFGGSPKRENVSISGACLRTTEMQEKMTLAVEALRDGASLAMPHDPFRLGAEREFWFVDKYTGNPIPTPNAVWAEPRLAKLMGLGLELLAEMGEIDEGRVIGPVDGARTAARRFALTRHLMEEYFGSDLLLYCTSTAITGHPDEAVINEAGPYGAYVKAIEQALYERALLFLTQPESKEVRDAFDIVAGQWGYASALHMIHHHGDTRSWGMAAGHVSASVINLPHENGDYYCDVQNLINLGDLITSELGALSRLFNFCGPYFYDQAVLIDGEYPLDMREPARNLFATAWEANVPVKSPERLRKIRLATLTNGKWGADRMARAGMGRVVSANSREKILASAHGVGRFRDELTGVSSLRFENIAPGAAGVRERMRAASFMTIFQALAMASSLEGNNVFTFMEEELGWSEKVVWGDAAALVREYRRQGPQSARLQTLIQKWEKLLNYMQKNYAWYTPPQGPSMAEAILVVRASLRSLQGLSNTLENFFNTGIGPLAGPAIHYARKRARGLHFATDVHFGQKAEEEYLVRSSHDGALAYLLGEVRII